MSDTAYVVPDYWTPGYAVGDVGTPEFDPYATVISQYANSPALLQLILNSWQQIEVDSDFVNFYNYVWNVDTAQGFGLDILGRIVGVARQIAAVPAIWPVTVAPGTVSLTDDQYRRLILLKAFANISDASTVGINGGLRLFANARGNALVENLGNMHMGYKVYFAPVAYEYPVLLNGKILTKPAGVGITHLQTINPYFGFSEAQAWDTFGQAVFAKY